MLSDELREILIEVWAASMQLPLVETGPVTDDQFAHAASLHVHGGWRGSIHVDASEGFAHELAGLMFGLDEVTAEDERDALGEMANVIGGNVKTLVGDDEVDLELPRTGHPADVVEVGREIARADCMLHGHPVRVRLHHDAA